MIKNNLPQKKINKNKIPNAKMRKKKRSIEN